MDPAVPEARRNHRTRRRRLRIAIATTGAALLAVACTAIASAADSQAPQAARLTASTALSANWYASAPYYAVLDPSGPDLGAVMSATGQKAFEMAFILADGGCVADATHLCLQKGRFRVEASWDANGASGSGQAVPGASADSGLFWFFAPDNWELMVKVLDGCAVNSRYWVFAAGTTDVHYVLTVTDTLTGTVARYENPAGKPSPAVTDAGAFQTCP